MFGKVACRVRHRQRTEVGTEHASNALHQQVVAVLAAQSLEFGHEVRLHLVDVPVSRTIVALQHAHGGQARCHAHGGGIESTGTDHRVGTQQLEDVRPTCYSRQRHAACNGLAEAGQIGGDAVMALRTAKAHAKACDDLVNAKDHAVLRA